MFDQSAERKAPQGQLKHTGKDNGSDAVCRAGRFARPHGRDPVVRPKPNDNARRPSRSLLPPDDRGQRGRATGLLRRLARFSQRLVTSDAAIAWGCSTSPLVHLGHECRTSVAVHWWIARPNEVRRRPLRGLRCQTPEFILRHYAQRPGGGVPSHSLRSPPLAYSAGFGAPARGANHGGRSA